MNKPVDNSGFSMIELMITVAIIGIVSMFAIPSGIKMMDHMKFVNAVNTTKHQLMIARAHALANPYVHCGVYFDTTSAPKKSLIFLDNGHVAAGDSANNLYESGSDQFYSEQNALPSGYRMVLGGALAASKSLIFRGDGSANIAGTIQIINRNSETRTIIVRPAGGNIRVVTP